MTWRFYPSQNDLTSPDRLERTFKALYDKLYSIDDMTAAGFKAVGASLPQTSTIISKAQESLQVSGAAPLNVQGLLGQLSQPQLASIPTVSALPAIDDPLSQDTGLVRYQGKLYLFDTTTPPGSWVPVGSVAYVSTGTYAARPVVTAADNGLLYYSTNQNTLWVVEAGVWTWLAGVMSGTLTPDQRPVLAAADAGFLFYATDTFERYMWSGTAWIQATRAIDSPTFFVDATNHRVGINTLLPASGLHLVNTFLTLGRFANSTYILLQRAQGTEAIPTTVASGNLIGGMDFLAYDGTAYRDVAVIEGVVSTATTTDNVSGYLKFRTRPDGAGAALTERLRIDKDGNVGINTTAPLHKLEVSGAAAVVPWVASTYYGTEVGVNPAFLCQRARGVLATPTIVADNDVLGGIAGYGYDGAAFLNTASVAMAVDGTPGTNDMPTRITFSTTADGAAAPTERVRITSAGYVGINCTPTVHLDVAGSTKLGSANTDLITCTGRLIVRTAASDPQHATPGSRPAGTVNEIVAYTNKLYFCTNAATPTWEKITSA
jgi:hypothetical protein